MVEKSDEVLKLASQNKLAEDYDLKREKFLDVLKKFSPGTSIRSALDDILRARMGALIAIDKENLLSLVDGGFRVNTKFSAQKLVELAKMDGAIILSEDLKRILYANTLLFPDVHLITRETGTRHKAAERTAKQIGTIVIAVSERKNKITLYYGSFKYELEESSEILRRASETLQVLEKQKEVFNDLISDFNILEINDSVTLSDVCNVLQRIEIINRTSEIVKRYLVELGKEGIIVSMRLKELTKNLDKEKMMIIKDYFSLEASKIKSSLEEIGFDALLEVTSMTKILIGETHDRLVSTKGFRILGKVNLSEDKIEVLLNNFKTLDKIFTASKESLKELFKEDKSSSSIIHDLNNLREKIISGKRI